LDTVLIWFDHVIKPKPNGWSHISWEMFGEQVSSIFIGRNMNRFKFPSANTISEPEVLEIKMLHSTMMFQIFGNLNGGLIVDEEGGRRDDGLAKFTMNIGHPDNFLASFHSSNVFCLCSGENNYNLKFAVPADCSATNSNHIATCGAASVETTTMVCIRVSDKWFTFLLLPIDEFQVFDSLEIP
jgi:hypothetical protein